MAIRKQARNLTLEEINAELEHAAIEKRFDDVFKARDYAVKMVVKGTLKYIGRGNFEEGLKEATEKAKAELKAQKAAAKKTTKAQAKPQKNVTWDSKNTAWVGKKPFTRHGRLEIIAVGTVEGDSEPSLARLAHGPEDNPTQVSLKSCRMTAIDSEARSVYGKFEAKTASGKPSIGVDDPITAALFGKDPDALRKIARENNIDPKTFGHLNPGMQRMTVGNRLRGIAKKGGTVIVDGEVIVKGALAEAA